MFRFRCLASFIFAALLGRSTTFTGAHEADVTLPSSSLNYDTTNLRHASTEDNSFSSNLKYHHGAMMTSPIHLYIIWYGYWARADKIIIRDFLNSFVTPTSHPPPRPPPPPPPSPPPPYKHRRINRPPPPHSPPPLPLSLSPTSLPPIPPLSPLLPSPNASADPPFTRSAPLPPAPTVAQWWAIIHEYKVRWRVAVGERHSEAELTSPLCWSGWAGWGGTAGG